MKAFADYFFRILITVFSSAILYLIAESVSGSFAVYACYSGHLYCGVFTIGSIMVWTNIIMIGVALYLHFLSLFFMEKDNVKEMSSRFLFSFFQRFFVSVAVFFAIIGSVSLFDMMLDTKYAIACFAYAVSALIFYFYKSFKTKLFLFLK